MRFKTVIFDLDGTLLETGQGVFNGISHALEQMGAAFPPGFDRRALIGPPLRYGFHNLLGLPGERVEEAVTLYREYYGRQGLHEATPYPGIPELLAALNRKDVQVCLATAKYEALAVKQLEHFKLTPFFRHLAMSKETETQTTKAEMLAHLLNACGSTPQETVMVGDTLYDAAGAAKNNVSFIGVLYGYGSREEMRQTGLERFAANVAELQGMLTK